MKKITTILSIIILLFATACDLDRYPETAIEQSQSFRSIEDAKNFNSGMYSYLRNRIYGIYMHTQEIQADIFNASIDFGNRNGAAYRWTFTTSDGTIASIWQGYYSAITNINNFLDNIDKIPTSNESESNTLNLYKGEAYLLRAYYYHQLALRFCNTYSAASAVSTMGLPLATRFDINYRPSRSSLEDTYALILDDIKKAKPLLVKNGVSGSTRLTKDCITALEARVYLDMGKYPEAAAAADILISSSTYPLVSTKEEIANMWHFDATIEVILQLFASRPNELPGAGYINNAYLGYNTATQTYSPDFIPEQWIVDLYDDNDIRKNVYLEKKHIRILSIDYRNVYVFNKYPGNPELYQTNTNYQHKPKVFRIAEMHLIKAEGLYMSSNESGALAALNALKTKRGLNALIGLSGTALMDEIKAERMRELLGEGFRLHDLKRWNDDCVRKPTQEPAIVANGPNDTELSKEAGNNRFVWPIPDWDMKSNSNLEGQQNSGY